MVASHLQGRKADTAGCGVDQHCIVFPDRSHTLQCLLRRHTCRWQSAELGKVSGRRHGDKPRCRSRNGGAKAAVCDAPHALAGRQAAFASMIWSHFHDNAGAVRTCMRQGAMVVIAAAVLRGRRTQQPQRGSSAQQRR